MNLIAGVQEAGNLSGVLRDLKKFTSYAGLKAIEGNVQESRRDWMLWIFKRNGARNSNNTTY